MPGSPLCPLPHNPSSVYVQPTPELCRGVSQPREGACQPCGLQTPSRGPEVRQGELAPLQQSSSCSQSHRRDPREHRGHKSTTASCILLSLSENQEFALSFEHQKSKKKKKKEGGMGGRKRKEIIKSTLKGGKTTVPLSCFSLTEFSDGLG